MTLEERIEALLDAGFDISPVIAVLDQMDGDPDLESIDERELDPDVEGLYLERPDWQSYSWSAPRECLHCGEVHICSGGYDG